MHLYFYSITRIFNRPLDNKICLLILSNLIKDYYVLNAHQQEF